MSDNLVSFVVLACLAVTVVLAIYTIRKKRAERRAAQDTPANVEHWMRAQGYAPEHFAFCHATAIAFRNGDNRLLLYRKRQPAFYPLTDLVSVTCSESVERSRPLGAAPGVVELNSVRYFNLDIMLKNSAAPFRIRFNNQPSRQEWEQRLKTLLDSGR